MQQSGSSLSDREQIFDLGVRYATALDTRDWALFSTCFTPGAVGDYEGIDPAHGYAAIEDLCRRALEPLDASQHIVTNFVVELRGDEADFSCYLHAQHVLHAAADGELFTIAGKYVDRHVRTVAGWRIAHRQFRTMWVAGNPAVLAHVL